MKHPFTCTTLAEMPDLPPFLQTAKNVKISDFLHDNVSTTGVQASRPESTLASLTKCAKCMTFGVFNNSKPIVAQLVQMTQLA